MKAIVTAEATPEFLEALGALGYVAEVTGWGVNRKALNEEELVAELQGASLLVCELEEVTAAVLSRCPDLRIVAVARGNPVNIDLEAAAAHGVWVLNTPGRNAHSVADFTIALLLAAQRGVLQADHHLRSAGWNVKGELPYFHYRGHEIARLTVGLLGFGAVGKKVAQRLIDGFQARILVHDPFLRDLPDGIEWVEFDDLFAQSDIVTLHAAVPSDGRALVGRAQLSALGPEGLLINTARAALVDEHALVEALESGALGGAALDVFWSEPLARDHPILSAPNVILTPHLAGAAVDVKVHHADLILRDLTAIQRGTAPTHAVVVGAASTPTHLS